MWQPFLALLGGSLAAAHTLMDAGSFWQPSEHFETDRYTRSGLTTRASQCGPAYNNQVCGAGQCCSADGQCGTGSTFCAAPACLAQYGPACDANQTPPGTNTSLVSRPHFGNVPYGAIITHCNTPGKVALTFDDGPYTWTTDLLDLLKTNNIKATFFITGNNGGKGQIESDSTQWPSVLRRAYSEGHQLASHTWSHPSLDSLTPQQITDEVVKNEIAFSDIFGFFPTYIRPPYGFCNTATCQSTLGSLGYHIITWDLDTNDWKEDYPTSQSVFSSAIQSSDPSKNSFIPLTHDVHYGTVHGFVQFMIDTLRAKGYTTTLVGECLNDPRENWYRDAKSGNQWSSSAATVASTSSTSASSTQQPTTSAAAPQTPSTSSTSTSSSSSTSKGSPSSSSGQSTSSSSSSLQQSSTTSTSNSGVSSSASKNSTTTSQAGGCSNLANCIVQGLQPTTLPTSNPKTTASATSTSPAAQSVYTGAASRTGLHALTLTVGAILLGLLNAT